MMVKHPPRFLSFIIVIAAWQTYRIVGAVFWPGLDISGGGMLPNAWVIPLSQDTMTGLMAPFVVVLLAMRPGVLSYALAVAFFVFGIVDFTNGIVVEVLYPPHAPMLGENMPDVFLTVWLIVNMLLEVVALALLLLPATRRYFIEADGDGAIAFKQSPMAGKWVWVIAFGALIGIFFEAQIAFINSLFGMFV